MTPTMYCPHGCRAPCTTCESSAAAHELRLLRAVADAARSFCAGGSYQVRRDALMRALDVVDLAVTRPTTPTGSGDA